MVSRLQGLLRARVLIAAIGLAIGLVIGITVASGSGPGSQHPARAATASADCVIRYVVSAQWNTGFTAALTVTNAGRPLTGWTLQYTYAGDQQLAQGWSGSWSQQGAAVTVSSESWNGTLATDASAQIGANFSYSGDNPAPAAFRVNGSACAMAGNGPLPAAPGSSASASAAPSASPAASVPPAAAVTAPQLQVSGTSLVDASGTPVVLHGVERDGTEFACVQGTGIFDGPSGQDSVSAMQSFGVTAVLVPLNEACWNGQSYVSKRFAGARYQAAIENYVSLLNANGMVAILDLAWTDGGYQGPGTACASARAVCPKPMPDVAEAIPFWRSVARAFRGNDAVLFDLFSAPFPDQPAGGSTAAAWQCWQNGGSACAGIGYPVAGMADLVSVVRGTGANNVILLGGVGRADDLTQWLASEPSDPDHDLAASWHSFSTSPCATQDCWTSQVAPVMAAAPVVTTEIGENDCADTYIGPLMSWLDSQHAGYLAVAWNADFDCATGPGLITSYDGTPTAYGAGFESHIAPLASQAAS